MKILLAVASQSEFDMSLEFLKEKSEKVNEKGEFTIGDFKLILLNHGVGILNTAFKLGTFLSEQEVDLAFQLGIAGASASLPLSTVVAVESEELMDLGAWDGGFFKTIFDLGLESPNQFPYENGKLHCNLPPEWHHNWKLNFVDSITVNTIMDDVEWSEERLALADAKIENMEGAAFYYACQYYCINCVQIRGISNHVGVRDKSMWKIEESFHHCLTQFWDTIQSLKKS